MLITCNGCNSKIRVPDTAAGKRVKCPKCATVIKVPEAEKTPDVEPTAVSSAPLPPPPEPQEPADPEAFSTTPSSSGAKPPPIKKTRASSIDDGDDDEPEPPGKRRRKYDDDEDEDDDFDVRNRRRASAPQGVNSMAMTSMILGIVSLVSVWGSCCCGLFGVIALACAVMALIFGFMGKTPGSESYAWAGIICGSITLVLALVGIVILVFAVGMDVALNQNRVFR
jgi:predicted Zn finger-like uncharacterized protein